MDKQTVITNNRLYTLVQSNFSKLFLYGIIGSFSAGLDFVVYYLLTEKFHLQYWLANVCSVLLGISVSFLLNRKYNFKVTDKVVQRFVIFLSVGLSGLLVSTLLLYLFIDVFELNKLVSKVMSIVFVVFFQFLLNKTLTFRK